jgi:hypothetical protein
MMARSAMQVRAVPNAAFDIERAADRTAAFR